MKHTNSSSVRRLDTVAFIFFAIMGFILFVSGISHGRFDSICYGAACSLLALGFFIDRKKIDKELDA